MFVNKIAKDSKHKIWINTSRSKILFLEYSFRRKSIYPYFLPGILRLVMVG